MILLGCLGKLEEVVKLVVFLVFDDSLFIIGEMIWIDGGVMVYIWFGEMLSDDLWKWILE